MIQLLIDRCIIFVSLELLLFEYNSNSTTTEKKAENVNVAANSIIPYNQYGFGCRFEYPS